MELPGIPQNLGDNLVTKACATEDDIERVASLNEEVHGREEGEAVRRWLLEGHPQIEPAGWLFVGDEDTGEAAATLALMPLTWRYGPVPLPVAELGFVATRPAYRRRGLQRALSDAFDRIALANGYALAAVEGIPYFYRQFGYEFAIPLFDSLYSLRLEQITAGPLPPYAFRPAGLADVPRLAALYAQQSADLVITTHRSDEMWRYYLNRPAAEAASGASDPLSGPRIFLMLRHDHAIGYLALSPSGWVSRLNIVELAASSRDEILAALRFTRGRAEEGGHESVGLQLPANHPASEVARHMGVKEERTYGWQMKVLDPIRFLNAVAPALEERLVTSALNGFSGELCFNLYRQKLKLCVADGKVTAVPLADDADTDVSLPPLVATQLWLGWKSFAALDDWHKDVWAEEQARHLLAVLFPQLTGTEPAQAAVHIYPGY